MLHIDFTVLIDDNVPEDCALIIHHDGQSWLFNLRDGYLLSRPELIRTVKISRITALWAEQGMPHAPLPVASCDY